MSDIATKLTYLNTTKQKIKDAINNIGGNITSETTFRQYVAALESIYQSMPKVSGTGTSLSLTPTLKGLMQSTLKGNTSQVQLSGKNLFNDYNTTSSTICGIAYSFTNNEILINGTYDKTGNWNCWLTASNNGNASNNMALLKANTTYTISIYVISGTTTNSNNQLYISSRDSNKTNFAWNYKLATFDSSTQRYKVSFTTTDSVYISGIRYSIAPNNTAVFNNLKLKIQIEQNNTSTDYEQYCGGVPSPNPSYPQDIHNVSGNNNVNVLGKNSFNIQTLVKGRLDNGVIGYVSNTTDLTLNENSFSFTTNANYRGVSTDFIKVEGTEYIVHCTQPSTLLITTACYDRNKTYLRDAGISYIPQHNNQAKISIQSDVAFIRINIYLSQAGTITIENPQLEKSFIPTTYEAYNGTTYPINLPVENLFDKDNANITNFYSTATAFNQNNSAVTIIIPIQENNNYTISSTNRSLIDTSANVTYTSEIIDSTSDTYLQRTMWVSTDNSLTTTAPIGAKYMYCYVKWTTNQTDIDNCLATIQLEKGSKPNTYTPYGTTPIELNKIGTYQDYFYKENDKWYLHKEIGKVVFNGTEAGWNRYYNSTRAGGFYITIPNAFDNSNGLCDEFIVDTSNTPWDGAINTLRISNSLNACFKTSNAGTEPITLDQWKSNLSSNNLILYYQLATPTNTEITDTTLIEQLEAIYNAKSKNGTTNINQENNDLPFIITASALEKE